MLRVHLPQTALITRDTKTEPLLNGIDDELSLMHSHFDRYHGLKQYDQT